jgi:hypothetical protein
MVWGAVYGLAALSTALVSRTGPKRNVQGFSLLMLGFWLLSNLIDRMLYWTDAVQVSAVMDAIGMSLAINATFQRYRWWKIVLAGCFAAQLLTHIALMFLPESQGVLYQYRLILNLLFLGELASVASPTVAFHLRQLRLRARSGGRGRLKPSAG